MSRSLTRMFSYGRNSLADIDRMIPSEGRLNEGISISEDEFLSGRIFPEKIRIMGSVFESPEWGSKHLRSIYICPFVYQLKTEHASHRFGYPDIIVPLWIPVILDIDLGIWYPDYDKEPWIPRNLLEPIVPSVITIGSIDMVDSFMGKNPCPKFDQEETINTPTEQRNRWYLWKNWGFKLLEWVSGYKNGEVEFAEYERVDDIYLYPIQNTSNAIRGLLNLYDFIIRDGNQSRTAKWIIADDIPAMNAKGTWDPWSALRLHVSHIPGQPVLSSSQRWMLRRYLNQMPPVYPVNGPPGTGKSTLLAQMIIQGYTHAAIRKLDTPPLCIMVSQSNQAISRMMEIFSNLPKNVRWTDFRFGLSCWNVSSAKSNMVQDKFPDSWIDGKTENVVSQMNMPSVVLRQKDIFLSRGEEEFGVYDLDKIIDHIHKKITDLAAPLGISARIQKDEKELRDLESKLMIQIPQGAYTFEHLQKKIKDSLESRTQIVKKMGILMQKWNDHLNALPLWKMILQKLPQIQSSNAERNRKFFTQLGFIPRVNLANNSAIAEELQRIDREMRKLLDETKKQWDKVKTVVEKNIKMEKERRILQEEANWAIPIRDGQGFPDEGWEVIRDQKERSEIFIWTVRYWEGIWIRKNIKAAEIGKKIDKLTKQAFYKDLKRNACLFPCLLSTIHSAPKFFVPWNFGGPIFEMIDLLIVDEAGQIPVETALPLFPLTKQVIVSGDPEQIEPIWGIPENTDIGNLMKHGLLHHPDDFESFSKTFLAASNGNLQKRVDSLTMNPLWLVEQHRSHPHLVDFCNKLSYENRLKAKRKHTDGGLPAYAFSHVYGEAKYVSGSWINSTEAEAIVDWIEENEREWRQWYGMAPLENILGIITPFSQQANLIYRLLQKKGLNVQVGTVHSFQGSERPIIIFSPVQYIKKDEKNFFDRKNNFLNVAVSRAKDSFWTIGNLNGWSPENNLPSGLLSNYLLKNENSWLRNLWIPERIYPKFEKNLEIWVEDSHSIVQDFFAKENGDIHIASPYFSIDLLKKQDWFNYLKSLSCNVHFYINKNIFTWYKSDEIIDFQDRCDEYGFQVIWGQGLMDTVIWRGNSVLETSLPFLGMDIEAQGRYYVGQQVPWWVKKRMEQWNIQFN